MKSSGKVLLILVFLVVVEKPEAFAQSSTARFLYFRPNAVSSSMGGIGVSYFRDAYSGYFNPAGLAFSHFVTVAGSFDQPLPIFPGEGYSFIGASAGIGGFFAVGASTNLYWKGNEAKTLSNGPSTVSLDAPFDWQAKISFAYRAGENIGVGTSISLLEATIADYGTLQTVGSGKSSTVMLDLGFLASSLIPEATVTTLGPDIGLPFQNLLDPHNETGVSVGVSLLNLGPKISFIDASQSDPPPSTLLIGATYYPVQIPLVGLMIGIDAEKRLYDGGFLSYLHYGSELTLLRLLSARVGYFQGTAAGESSFFTFGGGIRLSFFSLNFARYVQAVLPTWQFDGTFELEI